ncbi:MAG: hypothetical protein DBW91_02155 [Candidatus Thioglobus sp.]|nr:MAG: hypothetical protein DBW91_02155 [Candidatus Thioglobus sp.]
METFPSLLKQHATQRSNDTAIRMKRYGIWNSYTWQQMASEVDQILCALAANDIKSGDRIAIIGNNVPELYFSIVAAQGLGAVPVPMHADSTPHELKALLKDCDAKIAVLQDQQQVDAIEQAVADLPNLDIAIYLDERGMQSYSTEYFKSYSSFLQQGVAYQQQNPQFASEAMAQVSLDDEAFIVYTSGTSGKCKGALLTHANYVATAAAFISQEEIGTHEEVFAYLPMAYASTLFHVYTLWMMQGFTINCPESNETLLIDMREVGPTLFYGPPHFFKMLHASISSRSASSKSNMLDKSLAELHTKGRSFFSNLLVFNPIKDLYGLSKVTHAYVGGDVLNEDVFQFFKAIGINLKATYGTTESAGCVTVQQPDSANDKSESNVGTALAGVEVKVTADNEIVFKGINAFKGYYNDASETQAVIVDGWVHTGDIGGVVNQQLHVLERSDAISKFANGADFLPKQIENTIKSSPYIKDAFVTGEDKDYISALIIIDGDTVGAWAELRQMQFTGFRDLSTKDEVVELIAEKIKDVNASIERIGGKNCPHIKRFTILNKEFNISVGEMTRTRKIKRDVVASNYAPLIDALYSTTDKYDVVDSTGELVAQLRLQTA